MYRLERITDYILNGTRDIVLTFEDESLEKVQKQMEYLMPIQHFGLYQIVKVEQITDERTIKAQNESDKLKSQNPPSLPLGS